MAVKREKVVQTAEKYVQRGKIDAAIREYRKLLAEFPDDATTLNRLGDLYARLERVGEAVKLFTQIAENYTADGFFPKATAIYKKIIKLDPTRLEVYERLAELYHRQGLLNEARTQYQVLADYYVKHDNATSAIAIYERMVDVAPDDPSLRARLAELYRNHRLIDKAMVQYRRIAELMLAHGAPEEAEQVYLRALDVDATNVGFITDAVLKLKESGEVASAARFLAAAVHRNPDAERVARLVGVEEPAAEPQTTAPPVAETTAPERPAVEPELEPIPDDASDLGIGDDRDWSAVMEDAAFLEAQTEPAAAAAPAQQEEEPGSGEITLDLDDVFALDLDDEELPASLVRPPDGKAAAGDAESAAAAATAPFAGDDFSDEPSMELDLSALELDAAPEAVSDLAVPDLDLSDPAAAETPTPPADGAIDADFLERTAAELSPERIQQEEDLITEAEVLVKYGLTEKAMERLGELLGLNPEHPGGLGLLLRLHLDEGQYEGAAEIAGELYRLAPGSDAWHQSWEKLEATGFILTDAGAVLPPEMEADFAAAQQATEDVEAVAAEAGFDTEPEGEERLFDMRTDLGLDLDRELAAAAAAEAAAEPAFEPVAEAEPAVTESAVTEPAPEPPAEEMPAVAAAAPPPAERRPRPRRTSVEIDAMLASLAAEVLPTRRTRPPAAASAGTASPAAAAPPAPPAPAFAEAAAEPALGPPPPFVLPDLDVTAPGTEWLQAAAAAEPQAADEAFADEDDFFDLAAELEDELTREGGFEGDDLLLEQPQEQTLEEIVDGFKRGVAEALSEEDHQTHFDLGIAYREMGLVDEAIGEFQIAAKSPALLVECCSMLGLSFLDKGLPELAVKWYRRGLEAPGLSEDKQLGLLYDLGNAQFAMGEKEDAHRTFVDLYGTDSNYRDVRAKLEETMAR